MKYPTTRSAFREFKQEYKIYGTHEETDKYHSTQLVKDEEPKTTIYTMWQPITDEVTVQAYGVAVKEMLTAIIYDNRDKIEEHDQLTIDGTDYEIISIKKWHTHAVVIAQRLADQRG